MKDNRAVPFNVTKQLLIDRYPNAVCAFIAGSILRGEATAHSDLDIVFIYEKLESAFRDSYFYMDYPIDAFHHDLATLRYFFEDIEVAGAFPPLMKMLIEGQPCPEENEWFKQAKTLATNLYQAGPKALTEDQINTKRYLITSLIDDIKDHRSDEELIGSLTRLYYDLAEFYFRVNHHWTARDKTIVKRLKNISPDYQLAFSNAFADAFRENDLSQIIQLVEKTLEPYGGLLFDGFKSIAPKEWRK